MLPSDARLKPELSVVIPALHEGPNLRVLLPNVSRCLGDLNLRHELLVVSREPDRATVEAVAQNSARLVLQTEAGYGGALKTGFGLAEGDYVLTMDGDLSHPPGFLAKLWAQRRNAEVVIASRYVPGGVARMPVLRLMLSRVLNRLFSRGLGLPIRDLSSGYRLYSAHVLRSCRYSGKDFDILQEIVVRLYSEGFRVKEVPFDYAPRAHGSSNARVIPFGVAYLRTFGALWRLRNSIQSADYDDRALDSVIPLQRYWQRSRLRHVLGLVPAGVPTLDVGCGSSRILAGLPPRSVGVDVLLRKLRYARRFGAHLVNASGFQLPFRDGTFGCVVCSQVIEHVPRDAPILAELDRVLAPGGRLVLGTPDYGGWQWPAIEAVYARVAPNAYADEHVTHYTRSELVSLFEKLGYALEEERYILRAELILGLRKPLGPVVGSRSSAIEPAPPSLVDSPRLST
jgi:dolichol-phosphate mannosyltransferase